MEMKFLWSEHDLFKLICSASRHSDLRGPYNIFIRSRVCVLPTKPRFLKHRGVALVSWENRQHLLSIRGISIYSRGPLNVLLRL